MLRRMDDIQNRAFNGAMPNDNEPKCCFCFPLKCGIIMIGLYIFMDLMTLIGII